MNQRDQKRQNQERILNLLREKTAISQAELAELSGLQTSTVSYVVRALKQLGVVRAAGKAGSGPAGGKKAELLSLAPDYGSFGGILIRERDVVSCVTDFAGQIVERRTLSTRGMSDLAIMKTIVAVIRSNAARHDAYRGTGIAVSSVVNESGDVAQSRAFSHSIPRLIAQLRASAPELAIAVENDANCAAFYDHFLHGDRYRHLIHLHVPTRPFTIGVGIIVDGRLLRGTSGAAGEIPDLPRKSAVEAELRRVVLFAATLLDTEAVFITGEFDAATRTKIRAMAARLSATSSFAVELLENPDTPVLGASLQAIKLHLSNVLRDGAAGAQSRPRVRSQGVST